ncbi:hypothetical protein [Paractinoplanes ferrugineus]|uniref:hypothetical protein n=1 Tax=Paractinoplanes ferrugineus TaxID=113564 RepID=UPI0019424581|nr:hypothetical protein [Actinoplanes ferrugineus]
MERLRLLLSELGAAGWTGALHIGGTPGGVLHLAGGRISYAETPATPGLGERLVASGRLSHRAWSSAAARRTARVLLRDGLIGRNELESRVAAAVADAVAEILRSGHGPVRLVAGERHWLGDFGLSGLRNRRGLTMTHTGCDSSPHGRRRMAHGDGAGLSPGRRRSEGATQR